MLKRAHTLAVISIHALREEGDSWSCCPQRLSW